MELEHHDKVVFANRCIFMPLGVICCSLLYPAYLYYTRRHIYPISMRKPILSLLGSICILGYMLWLCIAWSFSDFIPTFIHNFLYSSLLLMAAFVYLWRAWILYFLSRLAAKNAMGANMNVDDLPTSFFHHKRYLITNRVLFMIASTLFILVCFPSVYFAFTSEEFRTLPLTVARYSHESRIVQIANQFSLSVFLILFSIIAYKLRSVSNDAFGIRAELIGCAKFMILGFIVFYGLDFVVLSIGRIGIALGGLILCLFGVIYFSIVVPLRKSYFKQKSDGKICCHISQKNLISFDENNQMCYNKKKMFEKFLRKSKEGYDAFVLFSKSEFSIENILFWKRCLEFKGSWVEAVKIYRMFLAKESPFEVNLPAQTQAFYRDNVFKNVPLKLKRIDHLATTIFPIVTNTTTDTQIFGAAAEQTLQLMASDTFVRFLRIEENQLIWDNFLKSQQ